MGIIESLVTDAREVGKKEGMEKGERAKERIFVQTLLEETDFDDQKIATLAGVEESYVNSIRSKEAYK